MRSRGDQPHCFSLALVSFLAASRPRGAALLVAIFTAACGGSDSGTTPSSVPTAAQPVSPLTQSAAAGTRVASRPAVKVTNATGAGVAGIGVTFSIVNGGGALIGATQTTDDAGIATVEDWILGTTIGTNTLVVSVSGLPVTPIAFTATGVSGAAARLVYHAGDAQAGVVALPVAIQPAVRVTDAFGNPAAGITVTFSVQGGGGSVTGPVHTTGSDGFAFVGSWTLGTTAGPNSLSASVPGLTGSPLTFVATARAATPTAIVGNSVDNQVATVATSVTARPSVKATDAYGNAVPGVSVMFAVAGGGGSVTGGAQLTNANGIATVDNWLLGTTAGANTVTATASGLVGSPLAFSATGTAGAATSIAISGASSQAGVVATAVTTRPAVKATDTHGNPVSGVSIVFAVGTGGGIVTGAAQTTNADGIATVGSWTLGSVAGPNTLTASASGPISPVTFIASATSGAAATLAIIAGNNQSATVATAVSTAPAVRVTDTQGNAVSGVSVTFAMSSGGGSVTNPVRATDATGAATIGSWVLGATAGSNTLTATVAAVASPATFIATGNPGPAASLSLLSGNDQTAPVGSAVGVRPAVKVADTHGNGVSGITVIFAIAGGGGTLTGTTQTTATNGIATVGSWTLGAAAGVNTLEATSAGLTSSPVTFMATGTTSGAVSIAIAGGNNQTVTVASPVVTRPAVKVADAGGNGVAGVSVTFAIVGGGGSITGGTLLTGSDGIATVGSWTLGNIAGTNSMTATASGLVGSPLTFTANGNPGSVASIAVSSGNAQSATVGTQVTSRPSVKATDAFGNAVAGVNVSFVIAGGGGALTGGTQTTATNGIATVGSWTLGTVTGLNSMTATAGGLIGSPASFSATGTAGDPTVFRVIAGSDQVTWVSTPTDTAPAFELVDVYGNGVPGRTITLQVTQGGGALSQSSLITENDGRASLASWTVGPTESHGQLQATTPGFGPLSVLSHAVPASAFNIDVRFVGSISATHQTIIQNAARRWRRVIIGDIPNVIVNVPAGFCGLPHQAIAETVDDVVLLAQVASIDGVGGVLASAGICLSRSGLGFPAIGFMTFDSADLDNLIAQGKVENTVGHEIGHTLGIGTDWATLGFISGAGGANPTFTGVLARTAFDLVGGSTYFDLIVPVENTGGAGTRDRHWRESVMGSEMMTGYSGPSSREPLSLITVASLADLSYTVSYYGAGTYTVSANQLSADAVSTPRGEIIGHRGFVIDEATGTVRPITALDKPLPRSPVRAPAPSRFSVPAQVLEQRRKQ
jgi:adhesin/invasin